MDEFKVTPISVMSTKRVCKGCCKVLDNGNTGYCKKCSNTSFVHLKNDLVTHKTHSTQPKRV